MQQELVNNIIQLLTGNTKTTEAILQKYNPELINWAHDILQEIETKWEVTFEDLFTHFRFDLNQKIEFLSRLIFDCAGHHVQLENDAYCRHLMKTARTYFEKELPERPVLVIFEYDEPFADILEEFHINY